MQPAKVANHHLPTGAATTAPKAIAGTGRPGGGAAQDSGWVPLLAGSAIGAGLIWWRSRRLSRP